jgi:8-amino-7-oxononanoate synthase
VPAACPFRHNDVASLERRLQRLPATTRRVGVCVDGVYSMEGDVAMLREPIELKQRYDFVLYVDDAHALGTIGDRRAGSADASGVDPASIDVVMGMLGKALGSCGGFIGGRADLIKLLRWTAPGFVFSTGLSAPQAAAALAAVSLLEANPARVRDRRRRSTAFRRGLADALGESRRTDVTPIVPVLVDPERVFAVAELLNEAGVRVFPVTPPAVPRGTALLRFSVNRLHSLPELPSVAAMVSRVLTEEEGRSRPSTEPGWLPLAG